MEPIIKIFSQDNGYDLVVNLSQDFDYKFGIYRRRKPHDYVKNFINSDVRIAEPNEEFDVVFSSDVINVNDFQSKLFCLVYHGPIFNKSVTFRELRKHQNDKYLIFAESQYAVDKLFEADCLGSSSTRIVGLPKMDPVINGEYDHKKILSELGLNENKKTVLYAPTYKPTSLYDLKDEIFKATRDYNLIIKLHHYSWMGKYANRNQSRLIKQRISKYDHAVLMPRDSYNILPLFAVADTIISEASGAISEFLITGKVGIIYDLDNKKMKHSDDEPLLLHDSQFLDNSFIHINAPSLLKGAIEQAVNPSLERLKNIKYDKEKYFGVCDGKASARIKNIIDDILSDDLKPSST